MAQLPIPEPAPRRRAWRENHAVLVAFAVPAMLIGLGVVVYQRIESARAARALDRLVASGEPVSASDLSLPPSLDDAAFQERFARFRELRDTTGALELDIFDLESVMEELRVSPTGQSAIPACEALASCLESVAADESARERFASALWAHLDDPRSARALSACERLALRAERALWEPLVSSAEALCPSLGESVGHAWIERRANEVFPEVLVPYELDIVRALTFTTTALALDGDSAEVLRRLTLALRASQRCRELPWVLAYLTWQLETRMILIHLRRALPFLPQGADLSVIEAELAALDPQSVLRRALLGQRAFVNDAFDEVREQGVERSRVAELHGLGSSWLYAVLRLDHDRAEFLESMELGLEHVGLTLRAARAAPLPWEADPASFTSGAPLSKCFLPQFGGVLESSLGCAAELRLARAALVVQRAGAQAGAVFAASLADPFDGAPLRWRIEDDGTIVVWSIGANLVDDHAPALEEAAGGGEALDSVWRIQPR